MSKNTKKQTTKYVSRWFTKGWLEDDDFLSDLKSFPSREEAYDYTKDMLDAPSNTSMPFAVIWEQKYPLLNLADGVDYGPVLGMLREIKEQLNDQLEDYSDARFKRPYEDYKTKEQFDDLLERIKKTIADWQEENNIIIPADYPVGWCAGDGVETVVSNWSDRKWPASDKTSKAEGAAE
ncbi:hypothetical protein [uncultured Bartonella sp.]|uniref:hypothetical protein n=1 Tax=uncultured Bartonella sp. TaxID=104108 RepID=UPI0025F53815|nr:hypothetical protein [uncultured Bartonella sp.]